MIDLLEDSYTLSRMSLFFSFTLVYTPIEESASWKFRSGYSEGNWNSISFDDSQWISVNLATPTAETSGTQYFRHLFTGVSDLAAYQLSMLYKFGIVAYINGKEVFRDNMSDGEVTSQTQATGFYPTLAYHSVIRNAVEVSVTQSVLAIEIHFQETTQTIIDFNAWMMVYASSVPSPASPSIHSCYMMPEPMAYLSSIDEGELSMDLNVNTMCATTASSAYMIVSYNNTMATVNAIGMWSNNGYIGGVPTVSNVGGVMAASASASAPVDPIVMGRKYIPASGTLHLDYGLFSTTNYRHIRIDYVESALSTRIQIREQFLYVCAISVPSSIVFTPNTYSLKKDISTVSISPDIQGFKACSVEPALPQGLTLDADSCTIQGMPTESKTAIYTITASPAGYTPVSGTLSITVETCSGAILVYTHSYSSTSRQEGFRLTDPDSGETIFDDPPVESPNRSNDYQARICVEKKIMNAECYGIEQWATSSFVVLYTLSGEKKEPLTRCSLARLFTIKSNTLINPAFSITESEQWYYKMGEVPANWYNTETNGWQQASLGSFGNSTNRVQLYKKTFNIPSLTNIAGFSVGIRYRYGVVVYLNNRLIFQNGFEGDLSTTSITDHAYPQMDYYYFTKPTASSALNGDSVSYLQQGDNMIAIGVLALSDTMITSTFDATVLLLTGDTVVRTFEMVPTYGGTISPYSNAFNNYGISAVSAMQCGDNYVEVVFNNYRMETLTSFEVTSHYSRMDRSMDGVTVKAKRSPSDDTYVNLGEFYGWKWWQTSQKKHIYLQNTEAYNVYRFENFNATADSICSWHLSYLDLMLDSFTQELPALSYPDQEVFLNIEIAEIFPSTDLYHDFQFEPALPAGLSLDRPTGAIVGTPTELTPVTVYTITARKPNNEQVTCTMQLSVSICSGTRSLITATITTSSSPAGEHYKVYQGRGHTGTVVREEASLYMANDNLLYADFCLPHGIYTIELGNGGYYGNAFPSGYSFSVDVGTLRFDLQYYEGDVPTIYRTFSSYLPFQINFDDWHFHSSVDSVADDWNSVTFDDSQWTIGKASELGKVPATTAYLRRQFNIPSLDEYHVLNVHMKYSGGVAAYFNGRLVARFNLPSTFTASTSALTSHDPTLYSKFHVILITSGAVAGDNNVIAFEEHRAADQSTADEMIFDATGVFGVNDCSPVLDSYTSITGSSLLSGGFDQLFDIHHDTVVEFANEIGSYVEWIVENEEGTKFNNYGFQSGVDVTMGFSLYGRHEEVDDYTTLHEVTGASLVSCERIVFSAPVGIASFRQLRWEVDVIGSRSLRTAELVLQYCKATGNVCPGVGDYPSVPQGEISPARCPDKYTGYSFRTCTDDGVLSEIDNSHCIPKLPENVKYSRASYQFVLDTSVTTGPVSYDNIVDEFYIAEDVTLPTGLTLDPTSGAISGVPTVSQDLTTYRVYAKNGRGVVYTDVSILVRKGMCPADSIFESTEVGKTFVYECSKQGAYIGTQSRKCILGTTDGEWQKASGFCMSIVLLVILILIAIIIIAVVVFVLVRVSRKSKAVGGVKGRKTATVQKTTKKEKDVKV